MKSLLKYLGGDKGIWIIVFLLMLISLVCVFSFVPILVKTEGGSPFKYLFKHVIYIAIGIAVMYYLHRLDPKYFSKLSKFGLIMAIFLLIFTFFFGVRINDASRWIKIPIVGLTFQTSDFAKLALILYLSKQLAVKKDNFLDWKTGFVPIASAIVITCGLIFKDNFSTAVLLGTIAFLLLFVGKYPMKRIGVLVAGGLGLVSIAVLLHFALQPEIQLIPRLDTWVSRYTKAFGEETSIIENAQAINAELAIHVGGLFGEGVGKGRLKEYLPEAYADFFFSSFVEEFGIFGAIILILLYMSLMYRIFRIGLKADKLFHTYVCIGIGSLLMLQASINMLVCTRIIPVTGQNIPFLAMGGSAMVTACAAVGIVQSIANKQNKGKEVATTTQKNSIAE
ncbi:FtsW/RodA/SpoVE family cell cycle protein [Lishizhenia sp.]|uniref:FtsW/RodA/SpoVE family cell cycle protein n=1 Tax=Lishizhenia sp. TaxID=2497594 RepID=UPI00299EC4DA|nr:FtsW/RodA/SpoVE family cell cycle protein [Lishizhenia sp.]MDX1445493.1 FtsW/RodA/SpoVE family cell cycle protein [Lishizhenia sp.]